MAVIISAALFCVFSAFESFAAPTAFADEAEKEYSNVLDDLKKDSVFKESYYPEKIDDYSLQIIQLAESTEKELFVYVYQPTGITKNFKASSINISVTRNDNLSYFNYKLEFLNSESVFYKYKVQNFTVKNDSVRYYLITSILRPFDETIDEQASGGNTVSEVPYAVNKQYAFGEINGNPFVECSEIETIVVTDKFVGFVRYSNGFKLYNSACDSHFVAFNTDRPIDKLFEADVYYVTQTYSYSVIPLQGKKETYGDKRDNIANLNYTEKVEHTGDGWFAGTYTWERIQNVDSFISNENRDNIYSGAIFNVNYGTKLTDEAMNELKNKKWVLRFVETDYTLTGYASTGSTFMDSTLVGDVMILRLKFETDGVTYNLGVIDNKQTGSRDPSNETEIEITPTDETKRSFKNLLAILLLIVLLMILMPILPTLISVLLQIVMLPFKLIGAIFKGIEKAFHKRE